MKIHDSYRLSHIGPCERNNAKITFSVRQAVEISLIVAAQDRINEMFRNSDQCFL